MSHRIQGQDRGSLGFAEGPEKEDSGVRIAGNGKNGKKWTHHDGFVVPHDAHVLPHGWQLAYGQAFGADDTGGCEACLVTGGECCVRDRLPRRAVARDIELRVG